MSARNKNKISEEDKRSTGLKTIIGKGTHIDGKMSIQSSGRVDGIIAGELVATETIVIGEDGNVQGDVVSNTVIIDGKVEGNVYASERIVLESKSVVKGDLISPSVIISEGSFFNGSCKMMKSKAIIVDVKTKRAEAVDLSPEEIITSE